MFSVACTPKAFLAVAITLWLSVLACATGCMQPMFAGSDKNTVASANHDAIHQMADMENCHHSSGSPSAPTDQKRAPSNGTSCCPLETTVVQKWDSSAQKIELAHHVSLPVEPDLLVVRYYTAAEITPPVVHRGRDTLLETHLLRI
jgi:hypothetical protein